MTAIAGTFADFKLIKTRATVQIIVEIPIEQADAALTALGGLPSASRERWVAMTPLRGKPTSAPPEEPAVAPPPPGKHFRDLSPAQQAGIKCSDSDFQKWMAERAKIKEYDEAVIADMVRRICNVSSRSELNVFRDAAQRWRKLLGDYEDARLGRH